MTNRTASLTVGPDGLPEANTGSVLIFTGTDPETGENVHFGVDHRPATALIEAVLATAADGGEVSVSVEAWQIIGKGAF